MSNDMQRAIEKVREVGKGLLDEYAKELKPDGSSFSVMKREVVIRMLRELVPALQSLAASGEGGEQSEYEKGFEAGGAFAYAVLIDPAHVDFVHGGFNCCKVCGLVRPADGWKKPCSGVTPKITTHDAPAATLEVPEPRVENCYCICHATQDARYQTCGHCADPEE